MQGAEAISKVREMLGRPRSSADFSPAARYTVSKLCDYAEQEHELREKAEERYCREQKKALQFSGTVAKQERTIDDLRQQLSFMRQALRDAGVRAMAIHRARNGDCQSNRIGGHKSKRNNDRREAAACGYACRRR